MNDAKVMLLQEKAKRLLDALQKLYYLCLKEFSQQLCKTRALVICARSFCQNKE